MFKHRKIIYGLSLIAIAILLAGCNGSEASEIDSEINIDIEHFEYTNQDEETVTLGDLEGTYWVANFIFTNCNTVCPPMTSNMANLQQEAEDRGLDVRFVSFSVDPEYDDPDTLKTFANQFDADYSNWDFLTGYSQKEIESFAASSFKLLVSKVDGHDQVSHGTSFFIVDPEGTAINNYSGTSSEEMDQIIDDLNILLD
ncbi:protein SCO1/2 [Alkalibacillus filiformis]|uniref:Protein SCO1/2 n=1 Tax=Alkalibacillus filiformis TaxID=200990 RepID=A0ABU0DPQ8_9BACI|nr:SCO family protein [Alkalibacillus filiformis]MDQ0350432.1 protein SCO1/2 [Alkalibacillus filiformis]